MKNATKNFDYITIEDRLRTVSRSNNNHPTGVKLHTAGKMTVRVTLNNSIFNCFNIKYLIFNI